jgi:hypothetical protein
MDFCGFFEPCWLYSADIVKRWLQSQHVALEIVVRFFTRRELEGFIFCFVLVVLVVQADVS